MLCPRTERWRPEAGGDQKQTATATLVRLQALGSTSAGTRDSVRIAMKTAADPATPPRAAIERGKKWGRVPMFSRPLEFHDDETEVSKTKCKAQTQKRLLN